MAAVLYVLAANFCFAFGSQFFSEFSRRVSPSWMNLFKALVAFIGFFIILLSTQNLSVIFRADVWPFILSGALGLGIGDILLLKSFSRMGPGRTLMLFGLHPFIVGIFAYIAFSQVPDSRQGIAIFFMLACLMTMGLEARSSSANYNLKDVYIALLGVSLDALGVILTRIGLEGEFAFSAFQVNFLRCFGALLVFLLLGKWLKVQFFERLKTLETRDIFKVGFAAILGTLVALIFQVKAIEIGNLAVISAFSQSSALFASGLECLFARKWPEKALLIALGLFIAGVVALNL